MSVRAPETVTFPETKALLPVGGPLRVTSLRRLRGGGPVPALRVPERQSEVMAAQASASARLETLLDSMTAAARDSFAAFVARFDFARHRSFADSGGATGLLACLVAQRHPQIACHSCDLPIVQPIAERRIREHGLAGRVRAETIDFLADAFPAASLIAMGMILHDWNVQRKKMLIAKAHGALPQGGVMVAPGGTVEFGDAFSLTGADFIRWCAEAGFARCEVLKLTGTTGATIAYK